MKLAEYDYVIIHNPGSTMAHVDALSRAAVNSIQIQSTSETELALAQEEDTNIRIVRSWIQDNKTPTEIDKSA